MPIKVMDYMDILFMQVNKQLREHLNTIIEMREAEDADPAYTKAYVKQVINQIYYQEDLAYDVYDLARKSKILKPRHRISFGEMRILRNSIDKEIEKSGYAVDVNEAHRKANRA